MAMDAWSPSKAKARLRRAQRKMAVMIDQAQDWASRLDGYFGSAPLFACYFGSYFGKISAVEKVDLTALGMIGHDHDHALYAPDKLRAHSTS